jgi:maltose O-acetyltransferase
MTQQPVLTDSHLGVEGIPRQRLARQWRPIVASLGLDAQLAARWGRRGPIATSPFLPLIVRRRMLRLAGIDVHDTVDGLLSCWFETSDVSIGAGSYVGTKNWFEGSGRITIGENCLLGPEVMIVTSTHPRLESGAIGRRVEPREVSVASGCWLGARTTLLPGVSLQDGVVIAAGAVVVSDCEAGGTYAGVPARRVK